MIRLTILGEPASKANSRKLATVGPQNARRTLFIKSEKAREYEHAAALQIPPEARQMLIGPVRVTLRVYYMSERPDLDESVILDVMQAKYKRVKGALIKIAPGEYKHGDSERVLVQRGVYRNDRQVREKHVYWGIDKANPRAEVEIEPMVPQQSVLPVDEAEQDPEGQPF
jgi:Holliday junction resolvase RusA-like endonuclease